VITPKAAFWCAAILVGGPLCAAFVPVTADRR
jgi:hypothetical protein